MLDSTKYRNNNDAISDTLDILRKLAENSLYLENSPNNGMNETILRKVCKLFEKMASNKSSTSRGSIDVSAELYALVQSCRHIEHGLSEAELPFLNMLAHKSSPVYALETLALWASDYSSSGDLIPLLHIVLQRGTEEGITREISGTLLRIRYARAQGRQSDELELGTSSVAGSSKKVWRRMLDGDVAIEK
jgi:hypothetical protein